jgi:hypothetical protein
MPRSWRIATDPGDLTAVWVPDAGSEALRDLVRAREAAKQDQSRARHRLSKFLLRSGQRPPSGIGPWTRPYLIWVAQLRLTQMAQEATRIDYLHEVEHMRERVAAGASHCRGGQTGLARVTASHQRSTGPAGYRGYLGCDHRGRVGPGIPLRRCSATDGLLRRRSRS